MYVIVIGSGRLGSTISQDLSDLGHDICVIDRDAVKLNSLGTGFNGQRINGVEFDSDNLISAGIKQADVLLAVTPDDNINITVSLVASKIYHVPKIIARANDPARKYIYETLNIEIINPTQLSAEILKNSLISRSTNCLLDVDYANELFEFKMEKTKNILVEDLENEYGCRIVLTRNNGTTMLAYQKMHIHPGDLVMCALPKNEKERLVKAFSKEAALWHLS